MYNIYFTLSLTFFTAILSYLILNGIRHFAILFNLYAISKERDLHQKPVPAFLGFGFLFTTILGTFFYSDLFVQTVAYNSLIFSISLLAVLGLVDDLLELRSIKKLFFQLIAVTVILYYNSFLVIDNLYGFLGINNLPFISGYVFTVFIGLVMINAFNLIDGIDGNAAISALLTFIIYGIIFFSIDNKAFYGLSILFSGAVIGYLPINFSKKNKGFMGDTGSMILGFMIYLMTLVFINTDSILLSNIIPSKSLIPLVPLSLFILPVLDTLGVYSYRVSIGKSPFSPDNFHLHHILLKKFSSNHLISSLFLNFNALLFVMIMSFISFNASPKIAIALYFIFVFSVILITNSIRSKMRLKLKNRKGNVVFVD